MPAFKSDSSVQRTKNNGVFAALRFGVYALSGIVFIPFLVKQYGSGVYGLIALAGFLTQYVGLISGCVGSSVARFLNIALNKNDWQQANEIYSTAMAANLVFICFQIPVFALGVWKINWLIDFPPEIGTDFRILVSFNIIIFFIDIIKGVFFTPIYAANRLDINAKFDIGSQLLRLALLFALISGIGPRLWIIGAVDLGLSLLVVACGLPVYHALVQRHLLLRKKYITRKWIRPVLNMASWTMVAEVGQVLFLKTDIWIINRFVGIELAGVCAALLLWPNFVQQIAKSVSGLMMPVILIDYAHERLERIRSGVLLVSRLFSIMSFFVCGMVMCFGGWLLVLWMGEDYRQYQWVLIVMMLHFPLTLTREALWPIFPAFNKMKYLGISHLLSGILNVVLSLAMVFWGYGLIGVVVATGISLIVQRTFFLTYFSCKLLEIPYRQFIPIYAGGSVLILAVILQKSVLHMEQFHQIGACYLIVGTGMLIHLVLRDASLRSLMVSLFRKVK